MGKSRCLFHVGSDCVYKNGKYYFYFPNAPKNGRGFAIGVATSDKPGDLSPVSRNPSKG